MQSTKKRSPNQGATELKLLALVVGFFWLMPLDTEAAAPTISAVADQTINEDETLGPLDFTVGDAESAASALNVVGSSSDQTLVPDSAILFGGSASNRTVTILPATNQFGSATLTLTVDDGTDTNSTSFTLTVTAVNDVPTITTIADQTTSEDTATSAIAFTIGDVETNATFLNVSGSSSDTSLVPLSAFTFGGSGSNRTVTILPATNLYGSATITIFVDDGTDTNSTDFTLTVNPVNDIPTISAIADQTTDEDTSTSAIAFTIGDVETAASALTVSGSSSDTSLVPLSAFSFGGTGSNRTVSILPATNQNGSATVSITVDDGTDTRSTNFTLTVLPVNDPPVISGTFGGAGTNAIPDNQSGAALFTGLTVTDVDHNEPNSETVTVTVTAQSNYADYGNFPAFEGTTSFSGTPGAVTTSLRALLFDPLANRLPVGTNETFGITVSAVDTAGAAAVPSASNSVYIVSVNDPPQASASMQPSKISDTQVVRPFRLTISDPDPGDDAQSFTASILPVNDPNFAYASLTPEAPVFTGSPQSIAVAVASVGFEPVFNSVVSNQVVQFDLKVSDIHGAATTNRTQITILGANDPPDIAGITPGLIRITDDPGQDPVYPFAGVVISDVDQGGLQTVTVTLMVSDPAAGNLSQTSLVGTPAQATAAIRAVTFQPLQRTNRVMGETINVQLPILVTDDAGAQRQNNQTELAITSVNGAPNIQGMPATQPLIIPPDPPIRPFAGLAITDDDVTDITATISLDDADKGALTNLGVFAEVSAGVYRAVTNAGTVTASLTNLEFAVSQTYLFPPNQPGGTTFTIQAVDAVLNTAVEHLAILIQEEPRNLLVTRVEDDEQPGSLRYAVAQAGNNEVITFALPQHPALIQLDRALGPIEIIRNLTIKGPGADLLTISGDTDGNGRPDTQLLRVAAGLVMEGLMLTRGSGTGGSTTGTGGAILVSETGRLTLRFCAVTDSTATQWGGAIDVQQGALHMESCLVRGNSLDAALGLGGGAIAIYTDEPCSFVNTTFSGNRQTSLNGFGGGAIYAENLDSSTLLEIEVNHCTFAENRNAAGKGSAILANSFGTEVRARNSIFADGQRANLEVRGAGRIVSDGGNVSDDSTRTILTQGGLPKAIVLFSATTDLTDTDPLLLPLDSHLQPTAGYPPAAGSPAIGRAVFPSSPIDQRGVIRDLHADAGAVEFDAFGRVVINELHFDPNSSNGEADFVELYIPRNSTPLDLSGFTVWVDGTNRHQFVSGASARVQPGHGIVLADTMITVVGASSNDTEVVTPSWGPLNLDTRGTVEVRRADGSTVATAQYVGQFVDPFDPDNGTKFAYNSMTLAPQFRGQAFVPHSLVVTVPPPGGADIDRDATANRTSPGADASPTPFGSPNAFPVAVDDLLVAGEDELLRISVLANDADADGFDQLVVVDVSSTTDAGTGDRASITTSNDAVVTIDPSTTPLRGMGVFFDPRDSTNLQALPVGAKKVDVFHYAIVDIGAGPITEYRDDNGITVVSPGHRLNANDVIVISGAGTASYNGQFTLTPIDDDSFSIAGTFIDDATPKGSWKAVAPRTPTSRSQAAVMVTVLGANDPPVPATDLVNTDEETSLRILADPDLIGTSTVFDTDDEYDMPPQIASVSLLPNDSDPDTDDDASTLHVVGVVGSAHVITNFAGTAGESPVLVSSPAHGLADGTVILISGYAGHPSYNGFQQVTVVDGDTFSIPVDYVDNDAAGAIWAVLDDAHRLQAVSQYGADLRLEIRTDRIETSIVYDPDVSSALNALGVGESADDTFYYAVADRHGATSLGQVTVHVSGVNDAPEPVVDPGSLVFFDDLISSSNSLAQILADSEVSYYLPAFSGTTGRVDAYGDYGGTRFLLADIWLTDEDTALVIGSNDLLGNDSDFDTNDVLIVKSVLSTSQEGATVTAGLNGLSLTYDPTASVSILNKLAREESALDSFEIVVSDQQGGDVTNVVAVVVTGRNDTPRAHDDFAATPEDTAITLAPPGSSLLANDQEDDIDGHQPDNQLVLVPLTISTTAAGAFVTNTPTTLTYDPSVSAFLDGLAVGQTWTDTVKYVAMDGSFIFANDDFFLVTADGENFTLNVLDNDRNLTGTGGELRIVEVGVPNAGGTAAANASGTSILYTPEVNFVGDEVFTYTVADEDGNQDSALVVVRPTVNQLNGNLQANADYFTVAVGESPALSVLANDNILPARGTDLLITRITAAPARDRVEIVGNRIVYHQESTGPYPYAETFRYEISGGGTARAEAEITVQVVNRMGTLDIRPDAFGVVAGSRGNALDVLANDNILPGTPDLLSVLAISVAPSHGDAVVNATRDRILYTPYAGFVGQDTLTYVATDRLGGTGTGPVQIAVGSLTTANDFFVVPYDDPSTNIDDGATTLDVLANDLVLQGVSGTNVTIVSVTPSNPSLGAMSIAPGGKQLVFNPAAGADGEQEFTYTISDGATGTADGKVTVIVVREGVTANADFFAVGINSSANLLPVLNNDAAIPDQGRPLTIVSIGTGAEGPNRGGSVVINDTNDRLLYTPAHGFSGQETFTYTITDSKKTDTARVVVNVTSGALNANNDAFTVFFDPPAAGGSPRAFTLQVLANDRILPDQGQLLTITGVGITDINATNAPDRQGIVTISPDGGSLVYAPQDTDGPFPYVETFTYEISDGTARRAQAYVTIEVQERTNARDLDTNDDAYTVLSDSQNNVLAVLANDNVQPASASDWSITSVSAPAYGGIVAVSGINILYTPQPGFVGTEQFSYTVSDGFGGTGSGNVTVKVGDLPLAPDVFTALSGSVSNAFAVLANDAIRSATATDFVLVAAGGADQGGLVSVGGDIVYYTPAPGYTGEYPYVERFTYTVQDDSLGTVTGAVAVAVFEAGSDRDAAILSVTVSGVNDPPTVDTNAVPVLTITDKQTATPFAGIVVADVDHQGNELLVVRVIITDPAIGSFSNLGGFVESPAGSRSYTFSGNGAQVTAALAGLVFVPTENWITAETAETTSFDILVSDPYVGPVGVTTYINIQAVNDPPVITGTVSGQAVYYRGTIKPFAGTVITEVDDQTLQPLVVTVSFDPTHGTLINPNGFVSQGGGTYTFSGTASNATLALRGIVFAVDTDARLIPDLSAPAPSETTVFTLSVYDGFVTVTDTHTSVVAYHSLIGQLLAADGSTSSQLGFAVAASRDVVVMGAPFNDTTASDAGAAYVYARNQGGPGQWGQVAKLTAFDAAGGAQFGYAVAISGQTIVVGAPYARFGSRSSGAIYVFRASAPGATNWAANVVKLGPSDGANSDEFGAAVTVDGDTIVVGSRADDDAGNSSGAAYVYQRTTGNTWTQLSAKLYSEYSGRRRPVWICAFFAERNARRGRALRR